MQFNNRQKVRAIQATLVVGFLAFVELAPAVGIVDTLTLPRLSDILVELYAILASGELYPHIVRTVSAVLIAFGLAIVVGLGVGLVLWRLDLLKVILDPYLLIYYSIPIFIFYPIFVSFFGLSRIPIVIIGWLYSVVIIVRSTSNGLQQVPEVYGKVGRSMNLSRVQRVLRIQLPAAAPHVFSGLKLGFIYALVATIAVEFILANGGLGWYIANNYNLFRTEKMYASMLFVIAISIGVNVLLLRLEDRIHRRASA